jgi:hypothetical protein
VTVHDDGTSLDRWLDNAGWHTTATSDGPLAGTAHCNNENVGLEDEKAARTPSEDRDADGIRAPSLALSRRMNNLKVGPREVLAPEGQAPVRCAYIVTGRFFEGGFLPPDPALKPTAATNQKPGLMYRFGHDPAFASPTKTPPAAIDDARTGLVGPAKVALPLTASNTWVSIVGGCSGRGRHW